ncbi:hypothetical protein [Mucilaginibacter sp.]|nr:hypothetical protein [Mucilaginibacter sp.]
MAEKPAIVFGEISNGQITAELFCPERWILAGNSKIPEQIKLPTVLA